MVRSRRVLLLLWLLASLLTAQLSLANAPETMESASTLHLPLTSSRYPWESPFGVEANRTTLLRSGIASRAEELGVSWVRLNSLMWAEVQPSEYGGYDWSALERFEGELLAAARAGMVPVVIVHDSPHWATINQPFPTSCGAVREDRFDEFASFMSTMVTRYSQPPFNVKYWEMGNEPDVDPRLVEVDNIFGCWGDASDPWYGGEHYGRMLTAVTPAIRQADPEAKVLIGGLLLDRPASAQSVTGSPGNFFEGILRAGAAPYFDIVAYHTYPSYSTQQIDHDLLPSPWLELGGTTVGKAAFLRSVMERYGVDKPVFLNETGLLCTVPWAPCDPPLMDFFEAQADYVPRTFTRGLAAEIDQITWYTLNGPGWRSSGLLDGHANPRPAYVAYQQLINQVRYSSLPPKPVDYGLEFEGYRFNKHGRYVDVVWSDDSVPDVAVIPQNSFIAAYSRDGVLITPNYSGGSVILSVGFSPVYIHRHP